MTEVLKIDDETICAEEFVKILKLSCDFKPLAEKIIRTRVAVQAAKKIGIRLSAEEIQEAVDDYRRCAGLHRTKDTLEWLDILGLTPDDLETFITDHLYAQKIGEKIATEEAIEKYFNLNAPQFDVVELKHMVLKNNEQAGEISLLLEDSPDDFDSLARNYSIEKKTAAVGGYIGDVRRGTLPENIEIRVFNASPGEIVGPFQMNGEDVYEIFQVVSINNAVLREETKEKIGRIIYNEWLENRMKEHAIDY